MMTNDQIKKAIETLSEAATCIANLDDDFKTARGIYNLDFTIDNIVNELKGEIYEEKEVK